MDLLTLASRYDGVKERGPDGDHPDIVAFLYHAGAGYAPRDEIAWCSALVYHVASFLFGLPGPPVGLRVRARAWLRVGRPVDLADAVAGLDIVVLSRGLGAQPGPEVIAAPGHVGFYVSHRPGSVLIFAGNQSNEASYRWFSTERLLSVRRLYEGDTE